MKKPEPKNETLEAVLDQRAEKMHAERTDAVVEMCHQVLARQLLKLKEQLCLVVPAQQAATLSRMFAMGFENSGELLETAVRQALVEMGPDEDARSESHRLLAEVETRAKQFPILF